MKNFNAIKFSIQYVGPETVIFSGKADFCTGNKVNGIVVFINLDIRVGTYPVFQGRFNGTSTGILGVNYTALAVSTFPGEGKFILFIASALF